SCALCAALEEGRPLTPSRSVPAELDLHLADLDAVPAAEALRLALRHELAVEQRAVSRAEVRQGVDAALQVDHRVVARGDAAVVLGQVELRVVVLARVAPPDPQRRAFDLLLPGAARGGDPQARRGGRGCQRGAAQGAEAGADLVDSPAARAGRPAIG